jgi:hypothetical protein
LIYLLEPYITLDYLKSSFGNLYSDKIIEPYFKQIGHDRYQLETDFNTDKKIVVCVNTNMKIVVCLNTNMKIVVYLNTNMKIVVCVNTNMKIVVCLNTNMS